MEIIFFVYSIQRITFYQLMFHRLTFYFLHLPMESFLNNLLKFIFSIIQIRLIKFTFSFQLDLQMIIINV